MKPTWALRRHRHTAGSDWTVAWSWCEPRQHSATSTTHTSEYFLFYKPHCLYSFKLATLTHNTLCPTQPAYLHRLLNYHTPTRVLRSANTNLLSAPRVRTTFASRGFSVAAPAVWNSLPSDIRDSSSAYFVAFLKLTASNRTLAPPSDSPKWLRFGHWLTLCTLNIHLLT